MSEPAYTTVTRTQGNNRALKDGIINPKSFRFDFVEYKVLVDAFRLMVREQKFEICEMAITTYICAKAFGKPFTAIPIFLVRGFHHGAILVNKNAGIRSPRDLEGKRVGVNRGYTVTTGVWARSILQREYGVDLARVTWVLSGDEHVQEYRPPANVVPMEKNRSMAEQLIVGDLAAAIGIEVNHPDVVPLIADADAAGMAALRDHSMYPINHLIVIKDELLQAKPGLATGVFNAFTASKRRYVDALRAGKINNPDATDHLHLRVMEVMEDPLPYGIAQNHAVIEMLIENAVAQGIIPAKMDIDELFVSETRKLAG